jgi:hypothetical protein
MKNLNLSYQDINLLLHSLNLTKKDLFQYKLNNLDNIQDIQLLENKLDNLINTIKIQIENDK